MIGHSQHYQGQGKYYTHEDDLLRWKGGLKNRKLKARARANVLLPTIGRVIAAH